MTSYSSELTDPATTLLFVTTSTRSGTTAPSSPAQKVAGKRTRSASNRRKRVVRTIEWEPTSRNDRPELFERLRNWNPRPVGVTPEMLVFARGVAWAVGSESRATTMSVARAALAHAQRLASENLPLDAAVGLSYTEVERSISLAVKEPRTAYGLSATGAGALRAAARAINPTGGWVTPSRAKFGSVDASAPYSVGEQAEFVRAAQLVRSARRRVELTAVLCLMFGAGLTGVEVRQTLWEHITRDERGVVWVLIPSRTTASGDVVRIPVLSAFSPTLFDLAELYVSGRVLLRDHQNGVADLFGYARENGLVGLDPWRCVNSWRVFQLGRLPVGVVAGGASLSASHVGKLLAYLPEPPPDSFARLSDAQDG